MQKRTPSDFKDFWEIFVRRRWWILISFMGISLTVLVITSRLPKIYRSACMILVEPQTIPASYVRPTSTQEMSERLETLNQQILSRSHLQAIIDKLGLYKNRRETLTSDEITDKMRSDIMVDIVTNPHADPRTHNSAVINIAYQGSSPTVVQQVTRELAQLFIEENLKNREQQSEGTTEFMQSQLERSRQNLQALEQQLKEFKTRNGGSLPEQQASNLQVIGQLQAILQANSEALSRAIQQKSYMHSLQSAAGPGAAIPGSSPFLVDLATRRSQLAAAEQKYKPNHPDVIRLRGEVQALERQAGGEASKSDSAEPAVSRDPNSEAGLVEEVKMRTKRQTDLEGQIRSMQARVDRVPAIEQQFAELERDYQVAKANYQELVQKKNDSEISAEMVRRAKGEQFRVLDPASYPDPDKPYKPDLLKLNLAALVGSLFMACVLGFAIEYGDRRIHTERDLEHYLSLPLLASLPFVPTQESRTRMHRRRLLMATTWLIAGSAYFLVAYFLLRNSFTIMLKELS